MSRYKPYPAYKESGVEWLDDVPEHWNVKPIKIIVSCNNDSISESMPLDMPIRYVDISAVSHNEGITVAESMLFGDAPSRARRKAKVGDVVISTVRTYLKAVASVDETHADCVFSTGFAILRARQKKLKPEFLKWLALNDLLIQAIESHSEGLSYPAINTSELVNLKTVVPGLSEQTRISLILDRETARIDALIAKKTRFIELLKEKRQALITHAVTKGLNPNVKMKDSGVEWIGDVPEHWEVIRLASIGRLVKANGGSKQDNVDEGVPCIRYGDIYTTHDYFVRKSSSYISTNAISEYTPVQYGDALFAASGETFEDIGKSAVNLLSVPSYCGGDIIVLRPLVDVDPLYFGYVVDSIVSKAQKSLMGRGFTVIHIYADQLRNLVIMLPPLSEQKTIGSTLEIETAHIDTLTEKTQCSINLLKERRSAFITAAVTGQIDLRESI